MNAASMQIPYQTYVSKHTKRRDLYGHEAPQKVLFILALRREVRSVRALRQHATGARLGGSDGPVGTDSPHRNRGYRWDLLVHCIVISLRSTECYSA